MAYLYRHIREDKDVPFYIGMSKTSINYDRADQTRSRNKLWHNIVNKTKWYSEIIFEHENVEFIKEKEIEFIKLYGRLDKGTGSLANLTEGGDGTFYPPPLSRVCEKPKHENLNSRYYRIIIDYETLETYSSMQETSKVSGIKLSTLKGYLKGTSPNKSLFLYLHNYDNGLKPDEVFKGGYSLKECINYFTGDIYKSIRDLSKKSGIAYDTIYDKVKGKSINDTPYMLLEDYKKGLIPSELKTNKRKRKLISIDSKKVYESITQVAVEYNIACNHLSRMVNGIRFNKTDLQYLDEYESGIPLNHLHENNANIKKVINKKTLEIFVSARSASESIGMKYPTFTCKLNGRYANTTNFVYLEDYIKENPKFNLGELPNTFSYKFY